MAKYKKFYAKHASDGSLVTLYQDHVDGSWSIGRAGDVTLDPIPIGAFLSAAAALRWADEHFAGGSWYPARRAPPEARAGHGELQ